MKKIRFYDSDLETPLVRHDLKATLRNRNYIQEHNLQRGEQVEIWWKNDYKIGEAKITKLRMIGKDDIEQLEEIQYQGFYIPESVKFSLKTLWRVQGGDIKPGKLLSLVQFEWVEEEEETTSS